ncbi:hypothetical protein [Methylococcus capsulatus]|uniref:hypothetical protein n=1 Tax=Methylococcus capsulatus TaxID=414 RepID=UPI001C527351|nr:hypothetical protein [Methylococcus capsulatus]QXP89587.1 hypothetical protein KW114_10790 [Methylococcus capsulatus]
MNDAENLAKLLTHLHPDLFRAFIDDEFGIDLPPPEDQERKRKQRERITKALAMLAVPTSQKIEEVAEKIVLLTDGPGQDVVEGFREGIFDEADRKAFDALKDQYERALWLYRHAPTVFKEALDARQADVFRQSTACYSGFMAPANLAVATDAESRQAFLGAVAEHLGCLPTEVAIQIFLRLRPDTESGEEVDLYQISIHCNRPPETIDCVQSSELIAQHIIRSEPSHITYEPANGHLEVLSRHGSDREALALIAAQSLLQSPITGERIPIKQYDYQSLAASRTFDLSGEEIVASVKVVELGYTDSNHRSLLVRIWSKDIDDIYTAAQSLIGPAFDFRHYHLNYAKLSLRLKKVGRERARTISIVLRDANKCNIKTKREKDRALCDRLLAQWKLVKELGGDDHKPLHAVAA